MIPRYSRPEISKIWDQKNKFNIWLEIECHACDAMAELEYIPKKSAANIKKKAKFEIEKMKADIHPKYEKTSFRCACGATWETQSTKGGETTIEICSNCHPFFTGSAQNLVDSAGRIEKFKRRYNRA